MPVLATFFNSCEYLHLPKSPYSLLCCDLRKLSLVSIAQFNKFGKFDEGRLDHYMKNVLFYINQLPQICKFCQIRQIKLTIYLLKSTHLPNTFVEKNETCLTKFGQVMSKSGEYCVNGHYLCKTL